MVSRLSSALNILSERGRCGQLLANRLGIGRIFLMHRLRQVVLFMLLRNSFVPHRVFDWRSRRHVAFVLSFGLELLLQRYRSHHT